MLKCLLVCIVLLLMIGCVHKPSAYEMAQADYGRVPTNYKSLITGKLTENLSDPASAKIEVGRPYPALRSLEGFNGGYEYGHVVHAWVTPNNVSNGLTQRSSKIFWWSNTGWSTMLPSLDGVTPKYPEQAQEYSGATLIRY